MRAFNKSLLMAVSLAALGGCMVLSEPDGGPTRLERWIDGSKAPGSTGAEPRMVAGETRSIYDPSKEAALERPGLPTAEQRSASLSQEVDTLVNQVMDAEPEPASDPANAVGKTHHTSPASAQAAGQRPAVPARGAALGFVEGDDEASDPYAGERPLASKFQDRADNYGGWTGRSKGVDSREEVHFPTPRWRRDYAEKHKNDPVAHETPRGF